MKQQEALKRLAKCREEMARLNLDGLVIPTADPHLCEYVPDAWKIREALSGFTGSAGTLLVTEEAAALLTDSRYWEQADEQLAPGIELLKQRDTAIEEISAWFEENLPEESVIGAPVTLMSARTFAKLTAALETIGQILRADFVNIEAIWPERPALPSSPVFEMKRPCRTRAEKLEAVRKAIDADGATVLVLNALDEIAWLTNLRGADVPCNPVFTASLIVTPQTALLFIDEKRLAEGLVEKLAVDKISVQAPEMFLPALKALGQSGAVLLDPDNTNAAIVASLPEDALICAPSPVLMQKSVKNAAEIEAIDEAMQRDAVALAEFYAELDERLAKGEHLTESDAVKMLHAWRARDPEFLDESFETIVAFGPNAALPHYAPPEEGGASLEGDGILLIDSGAQFTCGTTDITRMTPVGTPSEDMKRDVGLVTRAMLRLLRLKFPAGTTGAGVDLAGRMDLWAEGLDFGHGTGHGVGYVLNVHEGPVSISPRAKPIAIQPGNVLSDEPGVYRPGAWGVRVENLMVCEHEGTTAFGDFLRFRALTMMPIDTRVLPDPFGELADELNRFNALRVERLKPLVSERCRKWLEKAVCPVRAA